MYIKYIYIYGVRSRILNTSLCEGNEDQAQLSHRPNFAPTSLDLNLYLPFTQLVAFNLM